MMFQKENLKTNKCITQFNKLYHLTTESELENILENGLEPRIGKNSRAIKEQEPAIYLCEKKDIAYWSILLDKSIILQVKDVQIADSDIYAYTNYNEFICKNNIPPSKISRYSGELNMDLAMKNLCLSHIASISRMTVNMANYYNNRLKIHEIVLKRLLTNALNILNKLDYSILSKKEIAKTIKEYGESGEYALTDMYLDSGKKLYEQLLLYKKDSLFDKREELYNYIVREFKGCLNLNTGGFTL